MALPLASQNWDCVVDSLLRVPQSAEGRTWVLLSPSFSGTRQTSHYQSLNIKSRPTWPWSDWQLKPWKWDSSWHPPVPVHLGGPCRRTARRLSLVHEVQGTRGEQTGQGAPNQLQNMAIPPLTRNSGVWRGTSFSGHLLQLWEFWIKFAHELVLLLSHDLDRVT